MPDLAQSALRTPQRHKHGHWTQNGNENVRRYFDNLACQLQIDPLIPENWYNISQKLVLQLVCATINLHGLLSVVLEWYCRYISL